MNKSGLKSLSQAFIDSLWGHLHKHTTVLVIMIQNSKSWVFASISATHLTCIVPLDHQLSFESGTVNNVHFMDEDTEAGRGQLTPTSQLQAVEAGFKPGSWTARFTLYLQK